MKKRVGHLLCTSLLLACCPWTVLAQPAGKPTAVPRLVKFSGTLTDGVGKPPSGVVGVTFSLYEEEQGGSPIWMETQNVEADGSGRYTVVLGSTRNEGLPAEMFTSAQGRWLGVQAQGESERPRTLLVSVPYALKAVDAETLGGLPVSAFMLTNGSPGAVAVGTSAAISANRPLTESKTSATPNLSGTGTAGFVPLWQNSTTLADSVIIQTSGKDIAIGTSAPVAKFDVYTPASIAIEGQSTATSGNTYGVYGAAASSAGNGVWGQGLATSGGNYGVVGETNSADLGIGVYGLSPGTSGIGVAGVATAATGTATGVSGSSASTGGAGVYGKATAATGNADGVAGYSASQSGSGVYGVNTAATASSGGPSVNAGVSGYSTAGYGVYGQSYAEQTSGVGGVAGGTYGYGVSGTATGPGGVGVKGTSASNSGYGVTGTVSATSGSTFAVAGYDYSPSGFGVYGINNAATGSAIGVYGTSASTSGYGVRGFASAASGATIGVFGTSASTTGFGVSGVTSAGSGLAIGVIGSSASTSGYGVQGSNDTTSGVTLGVGGYDSSPSGSGVYGQNNATTGNAFGVNGASYSATGSAVFGSALGTTARNYGVYGTSASPQGIGVHGDGNSAGAIGVSGTTSSGTQYGVYGQNIATTGPAYGVYGESFSPSGIGTTGVAMATTGFSAGIYGNSYSPGGYGVLANATAGGTALYAAAAGGTAGGPAGNFVGNVIITGSLQVTGSLLKGSGSFKIDHPLDPANKYLSHSFVESPDMMNVYNGNVTTDKHGLAIVTLPDYFEALNGDFRYQLTVIGQFAQAIVSQKIAHNRFAIRTNKPSVEVSWQVTGIRHDAYAEAHRIPVAEDKPTEEQGYYLHPDAFGQPESKSIAAARSSASKQLASASRK